MKHKFFSLSNLTFLVALSLSAVAAYYSIIGLTAIFSGAVIPIIVMGVILEIAKLTTTVWLRKFWTKCKWALKTYLVSSVVALALLTSMGIFGFLSKSHMDQGVGAGDVAAKVSLIDEKIKIQRENIASSRTALAQMDLQVNSVINKSDKAIDARRSVTIRRQQAKERESIQQEISDANDVIGKLNEERAPIASQVRQLEAEVGPIKYIAAMIYGDNPDANVLERAVRWMIILIVCVFDPLAVALLLAASQSREWEVEPEVVDEVSGEPVVEPVVVEEPVVETIVEEPVIEPEPIVEEPVVETIVVEEPMIDEPVVADEVTVAAADGLRELPGGYVVYNGKHMHKDVLRSIRPDLLLKVDVPSMPLLFGDTFPVPAKSGQSFTRTDITPNALYTFNGRSWLPADASNHKFDNYYLGYLVGKIDSGEYDVNILTENERHQIAAYLKQSK